MKKYLTNSSQETKSLGSNFAKQLKSGDAVLLYGELGSGKTTFIQGVAKGLGITDRILSPTFVLMRQYEIPHSSPLLKGEGDERKSSRRARTINLYHIDLYRIEKPSMFANLGLDEIIDEDNSITFIEWAEKLKDFKPQKGYKVWFEYLSKDKRQIRIEEI